MVTTVFVGPLVGFMDTEAVVTAKVGVSVTVGPIPTSVCTSRVTASEVLPNITSRSPLAARSTSVTTTPETTLRKKAFILLTDELIATLVSRLLRKPPGLFMASTIDTKDERTTLIAPLTALAVDEITTAAEIVRASRDNLLRVEVTARVELRFLRFGNRPVIA